MDEGAARLGARRLAQRPNIGRQDGAGVSEGFERHRQTRPSTRGLSPESPRRRPARSREGGGRCPARRIGGLGAASGSGSSSSCVEACTGDTRRRPFPPFPRSDSLPLEGRAKHPIPRASRSRCARTGGDQEVPATCGQPGLCLRNAGVETRCPQIVHSLCPIRTPPGVFSPVGGACFALIRDHPPELSRRLGRGAPRAAPRPGHPGRLHRRRPVQDPRRQRAAGEPRPSAGRAGPAHPLQLPARVRHRGAQAQGLRSRRDRPARRRRHARGALPLSD